MDGTIDLDASCGDRALREAGPPGIALFLALGIGVAATTWLTSVAPGVDLWLLTGVSLVAVTGLVAAADRDGWRARAGMAYVAQEQFRRWTAGTPPTSPGEARAWLADPANEAASGLDRATALSVAGDFREARALLLAVDAETKTDRVRKVRLLRWIDGQTSGVFEIDAIRSAATALPPEEARFHIAAALWSRACLDIAASRPWRHRFAQGISGLGRLPLSRWMRFEIAVRQLAAPITALIGTAILLITP